MRLKFALDRGMQHTHRVILPVHGTSNPGLLASVYDHKFKKGSSLAACLVLTMCLPASTKHAVSRALALAQVS